MTLENILKRAKTCKNRRQKWTWYTLYKSDIGRLGLTPEGYQAAIRRLKETMRV